MKSLIVDDEFSARLLLQTVLSRFGEAHVAVDGNEAVEAVKMAIEQKSHYDLICLDIMMPNLDGHGALEAIRDLEEENGILLGRGAKVVMTTAVSDPKTFFAAFREQCDYYLIKPIDRQKLEQYLRESSLIK